MPETKPHGAGPSLPADKEEMLAGFVRDAEIRLVEKTVLNYSSDVRVFLRWLETLDPHKVTDSELRRFLVYLMQERDLGERSILRYFSALQSFYLWLEYEEKITKSPIPRFRRRYLAAITKEAKKDRVGLRRLLEVSEAAALVSHIVEPRDRALTLLLFKTGIRREEAHDIDIEDIDWKEMSITLKPKRKRTNTLVFFDDETMRALRYYISVRAARGGPPKGALLLNTVNARLDSRGIYNNIRSHAEAMGLYDEEGPSRQNFTPHATRHFFTTHLLRSGMKREYVKWLRGDAPGETMDVYHHIDPKVVAEEYRRHIPQFGL